MTNKPCYDKWWEWSHCIECAMCSGENACDYHETFKDYGEEDKEKAVEEVERRLKPAEELIVYLEKQGVRRDYLVARIYGIMMESLNLNP